MNQIHIDKIHPSPNPIRKTWDEGKMEELAQSIKERGVIVPIKIRPNGDGYEVVYGHRRVEAARRAGLVEMPAIVEGVDDTEALIQALIENVQREDMAINDKASSIKRLVDNHGYSLRELDRQGIISQPMASEWLIWLDEHESGVVIGSYQGSGVRQTIEIKRALGTDLDAKKAVAVKVGKEELNWKDTREVARAYNEAGSPELKAMVLETSGKLGSSENILTAARMKMGASQYTNRKEQEKQQAFMEYDQAVKDFIDSIKLFDRMIKMAQSAAKFGKFSPEGARFAQRRIDNLINELESLKEELNNVG